MPFFVPEEETLAAEQIIALQRDKLATMLRTILPGNAFYRRKLGATPGSATTEGEVAALAARFESFPLTTREELEKDQAANPPFGSNLSFPLADFVRFHQTSGTGGVPLKWLDRREDWRWWNKLWATIYRAAGVTSADRFVFPFSFGPFIGFWAAFESAVSLGNLCLPAGGMTTTARLKYIIENEATVICCTPTYALHMAEVAAAEKIDMAASRVRALIVAGEPGGSIPATRERIEQAFGARVFDHAGMTEMGAFAFECLEAPDGLHITESEFIAEVIDPNTHRHLPEGEMGELVLTNLGRLGMPLIRYRTGDLVRLFRGQCACGRNFARLEGGILGRFDDMVTIRGNNVFPASIEAILRRFDEIAEYRVEVDESIALSNLCIEIEPKSAAEGAALERRVGDAIRDRLNFRPVVSLAKPGSLPRSELKSGRWHRRQKPVN